MSTDAHDSHTRRILDKLADGSSLSQRTLAGDLGIALGLANLLIRRLIAKGWVRIVRISPRRVNYILTPTGFAQKARLSRDYLINSVRFYAEARERIRERFVTLSANWNVDEYGTDKRIVFWGGGELAEIAYICLQETDLHLVGIVDEHRTRPFFGLPVRRPESLWGLQLVGVAYECVVVMSFEADDAILARLQSAAVSHNRIVWIGPRERYELNGANAS